MISATVEALLEIAYGPTRTQEDLREALELAIRACRVEGSLRILDMIVDESRTLLETNAFLESKERIIRATRDAAIAVDADVASLHGFMLKLPGAVADLQKPLGKVFSAARRRR